MQRASSTVVQGIIIHSRRNHLHPQHRIPVSQIDALLTL